jgi:hypothetical protein
MQHIVYAGAVAEESFPVKKWYELRGKKDYPTNSK